MSLVNRVKGTIVADLNLYICIYNKYTSIYISIPFPPFVFFLNPLLLTFRQYRHKLIQDKQKNKLIIVTSFF